MYLHEDRELFQKVITNTAVWMNLAIAVVEKDKYVTMISVKNLVCQSQTGTG